MIITFDKATSFQICPTCKAAIPILNGIVRDSDKACGMYILCPHGHEPGRTVALLMLAMGDSSVKPFEPVSVLLGLSVANGVVSHHFTKPDAKLSPLIKMPGKVLNGDQLRYSPHYFAFQEILKALIADCRELREHFGLDGKINSWLN